MKRSLWCLLAFLCCFGVEGWASPAFVQTNNATGSATTNTTWGSNTTTGNTIVACVEANDHDTNFSVSVSDSQSNTYTAVDSPIERGGSGVGNQTVQCFYAKNITGGTTPTVTATDSLSSAFHDLMICEYSGIDTSAPLGAHLPNQNTSTTPDSGTLTVISGSLIVGFTITGSGISTFDGSYSQRSIQFGVISLIDKIAASTSEHPNWTINSSASWAVSGFELKAAGAGSTPKSVIVGGGIQ